MPLSAKLDENPAGGAVLTDLTVNGINATLLKNFVSEIEGDQAEIDAIMEKARIACQPHLDQIKAIKKEAAENGIEKKALVAKLRERLLLRRAEHVTDALSERQKEIFAEISAKLDDLFSFPERQKDEAA